MIKFVCLLICLFLLTYGIIFKLDFVIISGGFFYILSLSVGIVELIIVSKKYRNSKIVDNHKKTLISKLARIIEGFVLFSGLIFMMIGKTNKAISSAGGIIWFGSLLIYVLSGVIIESITKIPLEFGYGGWKIKRFKTRRRR